MVLSNKKLKQKLRGELAEAEVASSAVSTSNTEQTHQSFKLLLNSATRKPILSKREKRRVNLSSETSNADNGVTYVPHVARKEKHLKEADGNSLLDGGSGEKGTKRTLEKKNDEGQIEGLVDGIVRIGDDGKKRKKKEKKPNKEENGCDSKSEVQNSKKKKKHKIKHQKKRMKKLTEKQQHDKVALGVSVELDVSEDIHSSESQWNPEVSNKVYVGGIPFYSTEDDIRSFFYHCGTITDVDCMKFPESGKFRGIAIISFKTDEAAKRAMALDGADMGGLFLKIQPYKNTRGTKVPDFCPPVIEGYNRIYVGNLSWEISEDNLKNLFSDCSISSIRFGEDKETGEFKGYAHVDFSDRASVTKALKLDQKIVCGRPVRISRAVPKKGGSVGSHPPKSGSGGAQLASALATTTATTIPIPEASTGGVSSGKLRRRTCYECGQKGHLFSDCPNKKDADESKQNTS